MDPEEKKRRNYMIAGAVGGFLLPLAAIAGAFVFYSRDDADAARWCVIGAVAGLIVYVALFTLV